MHELFYKQSIEKIESNSDEDNNILDKILRDDVVFNIYSYQRQYNSSVLLLLDVYQKLKGNEFSNAEKIFIVCPSCIDIIISILEIDKLLQFYLFSIKKKLHFVTNRIWLTKKEFPSYCSRLEVTTEVLLNNQITPKTFKLSFLDLNKNFRILIEHASIHSIEYICSANPLITSIFSGKNTTIEVENYKLPIEEVIYNFHAALHGKNFYFVKQIWDNNPNLTPFFYGYEFPVSSLGNNINTDTQLTFQLSVSEIIDCFKIALITKSKELVKYLWDNNPQLVCYFSNKEISSTIDSVNNSQISRKIRVNSQELVTTFKLVLENKNHEIIKTFWDNNIDIRIYFSGKSSAKFDVNTKTIFPIAPLPISEIVNNFKLALVSKATFIKEFMLNENPYLKEFFIGKPIDPLNSKTSILCLTFKEILENFELSLCCNDEEMIQNIWYNNKLLADFFTGKTIEVYEPNLQGELYLCKMLLKITKLENIFNLLINNRQNAIINCIWTNHPIFANYYSGELIYEKIINIRGEIEFQPLQLKDNEILLNYNLAKSYELSYICESISQKRLGMISNLNITEIKSKPKEQGLLNTCDASIINDFHDALDRKSKKIVTELFNNKGLSDYLSGKIIGIQNKDDKGNIEIIARSIPANELIEIFKNALSKGIGAIIKTMWKNNPLLSAYFGGQKIESQIVNDNGIILTKTKNITFEEAKEFFPKVLDTKNKDIIDVMWKNIPQLQLYFSGYKIQPLNIQILASDLIENFKKTLSLNDLDIIEIIWGGPNSPIQQAIQKITLSNLIKLIEKVISICKSNKNDLFVTKFLNSVSDKYALESCLKKIKSNKDCDKQRNQTKLLETRISILENIELEKIIENDLELNIALQELINDDNKYSPTTPSSSYVTTQTFFASDNDIENRSLKRKLENEENQSINKRKYF